VSVQPSRLRRFVLLDRDGTLNVERHYLADPDQLALLPGVVPALQQLRQLQLGLVVVTNQSGLARGYFTRADLDAIHSRLHLLLAEGGIHLDGIYICPHGPDEGCSCRKPAPGLALAAAAAWGFNPADCFVVGDRPADIELGRALGATTILVRTGYGEQTLQAGGVESDFVAADLLEGARWIASQLDLAGADQSITGRSERAA
jgi:D-glycero-D-manno-heptose 1,7-bisphosphate phosphatase